MGGNGNTDCVPAHLYCRDTFLYIVTVIYHQKQNFIARVVSDEKASAIVQTFFIGSTVHVWRVIRRNRKWKYGVACVVLEQLCPEINDSVLK